MGAATRSLRIGHIGVDAADSALLTLIGLVAAAATPICHARHHVRRVGRSVYQLSVASLHSSIGEYLSLMSPLLNSTGSRACFTVSFCLGVQFASFR